MTKAEFTGKRDLRMSLFHRNQLQQNLWCSDIDCIEFGANLQPDAIIEYKDGYSKSEAKGESITIDFDNYQSKIYRTLADKLKVPFFYTVYYCDGGEYSFGSNQFVVIAGNSLALDFLKANYILKSKPGVLLSERAYNRFLCNIRNFAVDPFYDKKLSDTIKKYPAPNLRNIHILGYEE